MDEPGFVGLLELRAADGGVELDLSSARWYTTGRVMCACRWVSRNDALVRAGPPR
ncbi:MAG: hypothetical protein ACFHWZ_14145 [Phycisphaerales bacterium]